MSPLTKKELTVKNLILTGHANREIAELLKIKVRSVMFHVTNLYRKEAVHSRKELRLKYFTLGEK